MIRRKFLTCLGCSAAVAGAAPRDLFMQLVGGIQNAGAFVPQKELSSVEARYYTKKPGNAVECGICPRHCYITDLERGYCGVRENRNGIYHTLVYGLPCALNIDPIEKKPLFHFYPGSTAFSFATAGCNVNCKFCQNWDISQSRPEQTDNFTLLPADVVASCESKAVPIIAYTYSEPTVFYEYMYDTSELARKHGIKSVMISGGSIEKEPLAALLKHLDAVKIDLKSIRKEYYRDYVNGDLKPVLDALVQIRASGVWLEVVNLVVPTLNDTDKEFAELAQWIRKNLGTDVPLHFSRFQPQYLLKNLPPTPEKTLQRAYDICKQNGLEYVYLGNLPGNVAESTYCPSCGKILIERHGYSTALRYLKGNRCGSCNKLIPGIFSA